MADVSDLLHAVERHAEQVLVAAAEQTVTRMQDDVPVVTGNLLQSFGTTSVQASGGTVYLDVFNDAPYAGYVDQGTNPHFIYPTRAHGLLVFEAGGRTVFVRGGVAHPGTRANPFFSVRMPERFSTMMQNAVFATRTIA